MSSVSVIISLKKWLKIMCQLAHVIDEITNFQKMFRIWLKDVNLL